MFRLLKLSLIIAILLLMVSTTYATIIHVPSEQPTIQAGIDAALEHDTVLVADGTYTGDGNRDIDFNGKNLVLMSENGPKVTIIDCQADSLDPHRGFYFHSGEDTTSVVDGFTITGGVQPKSATFLVSESYGSGILCMDSSNPLISNNIIRNNVAFNGSGIGCYKSSPLIRSNVIIKNGTFRREGAGGGIACTNNSNPVISNNTISYNKSGFGGAVFVDNSSPIIEKSIMAFNMVDVGGASVGAVACFGSNPTVTCCNIYGNYHTIANSIDSVLGCTDDQIGINNNFSADPMFCDTANSDFHISSLSQCTPESSPCGELVGALGVGCEPIQIIAEPDTAVFYSIESAGVNLSSPLFIKVTTSNDSIVPYTATTETEWLSLNRFDTINDTTKFTDTIHLETPDYVLGFISPTADLAPNTPYYGKIYFYSEAASNYDSVIVYYNNSTSDSLVITDAFINQGGSGIITATATGENWYNGGADGSDYCGSPSISKIDFILDSNVLSIDSTVVDTNFTMADSISQPIIEEYYKIFVSVADTAQIGMYEIGAEVLFYRECATWDWFGGGEWRFLSIPNVKPGQITVTTPTQIIAEPDTVFISPELGIGNLLWLLSKDPVEIRALDSSISPIIVHADSTWLQLYLTEDRWNNLGSDTIITETPSDIWLSAFTKPPEVDYDPQSFPLYTTMRIKAGGELVDSVIVCLKLPAGGDSLIIGDLIAEQGSSQIMVPTIIGKDEYQWGGDDGAGGCSATRIDTIDYIIDTTVLHIDSLSQDMKIAYITVDDLAEPGEYDISAYAIFAQDCWGSSPWRNWEYIEYSTPTIIPGKITITKKQTGDTLIIGNGITTIGKSVSLPLDAIINYPIKTSDSTLGCDDCTSTDCPGVDKLAIDLTWNTECVSFDSFTVDISNLPDSFILVTSTDSGVFVQLGDLIREGNIQTGPVGQLWITPNSNADLTRYEISASSIFTHFCQTYPLVRGYWKDIVPELLNGSVTVVEFSNQPVAFDIKPGSCPNPMNMKRNRGHAVLPTAILGTDDFDVHDIDPSTITMLGVVPVRWSYDDVGSPIDETDSCQCTEDGPDGYTDLTLKFDRNSLLDTLMNLPFEALRELTVIGMMNGETEFEGTDCIRLLKHDRDFEISEIDGDIIPLEAILVGNNPNPFNPTTTISYGLPSQQKVTIEIFNMLGQKVVTLLDKSMPAGYHTVEWDGSNLSSGIYLYRLTTNEFIETKKMILIK